MTVRGGYVPELMGVCCLMTTGFGFYVGKTFPAIGAYFAVIGIASLAVTAKVRYDVGY